MKNVSGDDVSRALLHSIPPVSTPVVVCICILYNIRALLLLCICIEQHGVRASKYAYAYAYLKKTLDDPLMFYLA